VYRGVSVACARGVGRFSGGEADFGGESSKAAARRVNGGTEASAHLEAPTTRPTRAHRVPAASVEALKTPLGSSIGGEAGSLAPAALRAICDLC